MIPEAWDFAVTSCLRPATRNPGPTTTSAHLTWTFHDTANRSHRNGLGFTPVVFDGHAPGLRGTHATWSPSHQLSTTSLRTPSDTALELAQRISSSLHRDSARAVLRHVRLTSRDAPPRSRRLVASV